MNLEQIYTAIDLVRNSRYRSNARETTMLRTYPVLVSAAQVPAANPVEAYLRTASLAYAWMPQALRLDGAHLTAAAAALESVRGETPAISEQVIDPIAACLGSLIGASKVLHLANPAVFPLWNQRVEGFRLQEPPSAYHMGQSRSYLGFIEEIRDLSTHPLFLTFHHDYCTAFQSRLQRLNIPPYPLTEPRVVESAVSELAAD